MKTLTVIISLAFILFYGVCEEIEEKDITRYYKARVESCPGCALNRLHDVKTFVYEDLPKYDRVEFKKIQGAPPEIVFLDEAEQEIERISLKDLNREQCNHLLVSRGFLLKLAAKIAANQEL